MTAAPDKVLVTGASGFLGGHVCTRLVARGLGVRGLVRAQTSALPAGVERASASDLLDRAAIRTAMEGVSTVVHLAARVHVMEERAADPLQAFREVNVEGTRALAEEAQRAGVRTFVFVSSVKAVGESSSSTPWHDGVAPAPVDPYGVSKLEAERLLADLSARSSFGSCTIRLPLVYGPGMKGNMRRLFEVVDRGWPLPFGAVDNRRALIYSGNVAAAIEAAIRSDTTTPALRGPFFVSDGEDVSTATLVRAIARSLDRPARLVPVPPALIRAAGRTGDVLRKILPFPFSSAHADRLLGSLSLDTSGFAHATSFRPPFTMQEGLKVTALWYRSLSQPQSVPVFAAGGEVSGR